VGAGRYRTEVTAGSGASNVWLKENRSAAAPVWYSIPSVAELPRSRPSAAMFRYWVRISPFSWRTMLKSIRRVVSLKKWTLRNSITKRRFGAVPRTSARIDAWASTSRSSQYP
jgi:hypothetical protein